MCPVGTDRRWLWAAAGSSAGVAGGGPAEARCQVVGCSTYGIRSIVFYIYIALYGAYPILGIMFAVLFILCYLVEVYYMIAIRSFSTSIYRSSIPSKIYQRSRSTMKTDFTN